MNSVELFHLATNHYKLCGLLKEEEYSEGLEMALKHLNAEYEKVVKLLDPDAYNNVIKPKGRSVYARRKVRL